MRLREVKQKRNQTEAEIFGLIGFILTNHKDICTWCQWMWILERLLRKSSLRHVGISNNGSHQ